MKNFLLLLLLLTIKQLEASYFYIFPLSNGIRCIVIGTTFHELQLFKEGIGTSAHPCIMSVELKLDLKISREKNDKSNGKNETYKY